MIVAQPCTANAWQPRRWISVASFLAPLYPESFTEFPTIMTAVSDYQKSDGHFGADQQLPTLDHERDTPILWGNGRILLGLMEVSERTGDKAASLITSIQ